MNKIERIKRAHDIVDIIEGDYYLTRTVAASVMGTETFYLSNPNVRYEPNYQETEISVTDETTVDAILRVNRENERMQYTMAVNFASFISPGGSFMQGGMAQEEHLCHNSTLYPVLNSFRNSYYEITKTMIDDHIYHNQCLFSPGVVVTDSMDDIIRTGSWTHLQENWCPVNILTIAAPVNSNILNKLHPGRSILNNHALRERIDLILAVAATKGMQVVITGAFGCGVFKQDPHRVAFIFKDLLKTKYNGVFRKVIFAIPDESSKNHQVFYKMFK